LTLRTLCGLTTEEIARAFLVPVPTMAQRLVRAKGKIRETRIPYRVPDLEELPARLDEVMAVVYLVFNEGYSTPSRRDLCAEAIYLGRMLRELLPSGSTELDALLALMLFHDSRRNARFDEGGNVILLADQDRRKWDCAEISEGRALVESAFRRGAAGPYAIEAAIAALHTEAETDWPQIAALYERLYALHASPVVALNRAVAVAMAEGPAAALPLVDALKPQLHDYHLYHATRADLLRRLNRTEEALTSYERALELTTSDSDRRFLTRRISELRRH
jgi:RNA polymerase sigma-70 factor (ECF subfamily)